MKGLFTICSTASTTAAKSASDMSQIDTFPTDFVLPSVEGGKQMLGIASQDTIVVPFAMINDIKLAPAGYEAVDMFFALLETDDIPMTGWAVSQ